MKLLQCIDGLLVGTRYLAWAIGIAGVIASVFLIAANLPLGISSAVVFAASLLLAVGVSLVLLPGFEETYLHGDVVAYGVLVQLAVDHDWERLKEAKEFLKSLESPSTLAEMHVPLDREYLREVLKETVNGPDMEHIPYPVTEDMIYEAMEAVEKLG